MQENFNTIKKGIFQGWNIQPSPTKLYNFYNHIFFGIFRVIGGISVLLVFTKNYFTLPDQLQKLILVLALIQFIQMTIYFFS